MIRPLFQEVDRQPTSVRVNINPDFEDDQERQSSFSSGRSATGEAGSGPRSGPARRPHTFFQRTPSTLALGCPGPDPINTPLENALPLAYK